MNGEIEYFSNKQGCGYIEESADAIKTDAVGFKIAGVKIEPGDMTDLVGFFCRVVKYLGKLGKNELVFYLGQDDGMFPRHYFQSVLWLSKTRIYEQFHPQHGRDFNFVGGVWK